MDPSPEAPRTNRVPAQPSMNRLPDPPRDGLTIPPQRPRTEPLELAESPRLRSLMAEIATNDSVAADRFWREIEESGTPLVEEIDGDPRHRAVTFLHRSAGDPRPVLLANKLTTPHAPETAFLKRIPATDIHALTLRLPADLRGSYAIGFAAATEAAPDARVLRLAERSARAGQALDEGMRSRWMKAQGSAAPDPLARNTGTWLDAHLPASVFSLPRAPALKDFEGERGQAGTRAGTQAGAPAQNDVHGAPGLGRGTLRALVSAAGRRYHVYLPHDHDPARERPYPLLVMTDAENWLRGNVAAHILDRRIADGELPGLVAVLVEQGPVEDRIRDLAASPDFLEELGGDILPAVEVGFRASSDPKETMIAGQSLGGLTAAYAVLARPDRFGLALAQSGSFWWPTPATPDGAAEWLTSVVPAAPANARIHLEVGLQEWVLLEPTRRFRDALERHGHAVTYSEFSGGHDTICWTAALGDALAGLWSRRAAATPGARP